MAIVWSNSFDGTPGQSVTVANSAAYGNPIAGLRNNPPPDAVRYGDQAVMGGASLRLGTDAGTPHGDVWLHYPTLNEYSISAYLLVPQGTWLRVRDANIITELYLATESGQYFLGTHAVPAETAAQLIGRWVRVEVSATLERMAYRLYWTDVHSTGAPDYEYSEGRAAGSTVGGIFTQGAGIASAPTPYIDQIRIGEGEWLGPWPTHQQFSASGALPLAGSATITAALDDGPIRATGSLPLSGSAAITRHATLAAAGTVGDLTAAPAAIAREGRFGASATLPLAAHPAVVRGTFRPTFPPALTAEILLGEEWVDITGDVRVEEDVAIGRGRADEAARADPSSLSLMLNNRHGRYSPRNPLGPYYGRLGRNTPLRVRVGELPEPGAVILRDAFSRTVSSGWGTADTGQPWQVFTDHATNRVWVGEGAGRMEMGTINTLPGARTPPMPADLDAVWTFSLSDLPRGMLPGAVFCNLEIRRHMVGGLLYSLRTTISVRVFGGAPDGRCRVSAHINAYRGAAISPVTPVDAVAPAVTYAAGEKLTARVLADGPSIKVKVWPAGTPEPAAWLAQGWVEDIVGDGPVEFQAVVSPSADATVLPLTVAFRGITIREPVPVSSACRFYGEVSSWPSRWSLSDTDVWVPVAAAGISRRLGQGAKPLRSTLRRVLPTYRPLAYWPMEDGSAAGSAAEVSGTAGPLLTSGLVFAEEDSLATSEALPTVRPGARIQSGPIRSIGTGSWEVDMLVRMAEPTEATTNQDLLDVTSSTVRVRVITRQWTDGRPIIAAYTYDPDGALLGSWSMYTDQTDAPLVYGQWARLRIIAWTGPLCVTRLDIADAAEQYRGGQHTYTYSPGVGTLSRINTVFGAALGDVAIGHITAWGARYSNGYFTSFSGFAGETTATRLSRLGTSEGVPILVTGDANTALGPEPAGTLLEGVGAATDADLGVPGEPRDDLGLMYRARSTLYNQPPVITLDYRAGTISDPVEPQDDDQNTRNDVEVKRASGSSYQVVDEDGPLGVNRVGRYDESVTLSLADDAQLPDQAGWRLHLGTVDELRWPTIHLNLANPRMREHIPDLIGLDTGDRIRILNPPLWTQSSALDLIVQGYEERINAFAWDLVLTCTPASPWTVGEVPETGPAVVEPSAPDRADTAGSVLAAPVSATDTVLDVATVQGPPWITTSAHPGDFPLDVVLGGEVVRVTGIAPSAAGQAFTVIRSINNIVKGHGTGTDVRLAQPLIVAL
ncbi:hypothetical protein [Nocardiopsis sp. CA-288880]|uniref:hypothetical protein n=1 Tax=Nocardiopsis sp. CA-288880 TaxID=3239995 RepID=UPI003D98322B